MLTLAAGYNCLLHGVGSKRAIIDRLCTEHLQVHKCSYVRVNGHDPTETMRTVLATIAATVMALAGTNAAGSVSAWHNY